MVNNKNILFLPRTRIEDVSYMKIFHATGILRTPQEQKERFLVLKYFAAFQILFLNMGTIFMNP